MPRNKSQFENECAWSVQYKGPLHNECVLIIAPTVSDAIDKALIYQGNYAVLKDWPIVSVVRQADTII